MTKKSVTERAQHLLKVLIERYIRDGQPVGSRTLAEDAGMNLSPATIRNIMGDLEERGYVRSPHTSAGRIPTTLGFRFFVDSLLTVKPLDENAIAQVQQQLNPDLDAHSLVASASSLLSKITKQAGLVTLPRREQLKFRHVEFLPLSENRVLVILVMNAQEVQNRIIYTDRIYNQQELQQVANYLNAHYAGKDLFSVRKKLLTAMQADRKQLNQLMNAAIDVADKTFSEVPDGGDYVIAGQTNLLELAGNTSIDKLRQLFEAFSEKNEILRLLDHCLHAEGIQIYIGKESGYELFDECSMVTVPYSVENEVVGVLGVIGPTRMPYDKVISAVDLTAKLLSAALNK